MIEFRCWLYGDLVFGQCNMEPQEVSSLKGKVVVRKMLGFFSMLVSGLPISVFPIVF